MDLKDGAWELLRLSRGKRVTGMEVAMGQGLIVVLPLCFCLGFFRFFSFRLFSHSGFVLFSCFVVSQLFMGGV